MHPLVWLIGGAVAFYLAFESKQANANVNPNPEPAKVKTGGDWQLPAKGAPYADAIKAAETSYGLPDRLLARVLYQESRFRDDIIDGETLSPAGAIGIAQFMPATAEELGVDPLDVNQAIDGAGRYLQSLYGQFGNWPEAIGAYNAGPGNIRKRGIAGSKPETQTYVAEITHDVFGTYA